MVQLGEHFASKGRGSQSEWLHQQRWFIKARQDNERREKAQDRLEDDLVGLAVEAVMATQEQLADFEMKLDSYDEATVNALMENQKLLDAVNARMEALLEQAYVMEDERRVFKTQDGLQVFDEHGTEVSSAELDFALIPETAPKWETYQSELEHRETLVAERTEILDYQEKLDAAREEIDGGEISEADLEALDADLLEAMPDAVRTHAGLDPREVTPSLTTAFSVPAGLPTVQIQSAEVSTPAPAPFQ